MLGITSCQIDIERLVAIIQLQFRENVWERKSRKKMVWVHLRRKKKTYIYNSQSVHPSLNCFYSQISKSKIDLKKHTHSYQCESTNITRTSTRLISNRRLFTVNFVWLVYRKRLAFMFEVAIHFCLSPTIHNNVLIAWQWCCIVFLKWTISNASAHSQAIFVR